MFSPKIKRFWEKCCIWIKIKIGLYCVTRGYCTTSHSLTI